VSAMVRSLRSPCTWQTRFIGANPLAHVPIPSS
jgi:hypothetical protein